VGSQRHGMVEQFEAGFVADAATAASSGAAHTVSDADDAFGSRAPLNRVGYWLLEQRIEPLPLPLLLLQL